MSFLLSISQTPAPPLLYPARSYEAWMSWDSNPLYALLHESIYCQGAPSNWAAQRLRSERWHAEFDALAAAREGACISV